MHKLRKGT